jgi:hypothetical protein
MWPFIILTTAIILAGIFTFFIFNRKSYRFEPEEIIESLHHIIFPGGQSQIEKGAQEIIRLLKGKVNLQEANEIYALKGKNFFFERFDPSNDTLRNHWKNKDHAKLNYFDKIDLYEFFISENTKLQKEFWNHGFCMGQVKKSSRDNSQKIKILDNNDSFLRILDIEKVPENDLNINLLRNSIPESVIQFFEKVANNGRPGNLDFRMKNSGLAYKLFCYSPRKGRFISFFQLIGQNSIGNQKSA